jgi:hypothetical protein
VKDIVKEVVKIIILNDSPEEKQTVLNNEENDILANQISELLLRQKQRPRRRKVTRRPIITNAIDNGSVSNKEF